MTCRVDNSTETETNGLYKEHGSYECSWVDVCATLSVFTFIVLLELRLEERVYDGRF